jgi:sugar O-acyltransferase (sialic acid O-acetyltransferase NeuD family)
MLIVGAGGHAKELLGILKQQKASDGVFFYDDVTKDLPTLLFNQFKILQNEHEAKAVLNGDPRFIVGVGNPIFRFQLAEKFTSWGGELTSLISSSASIGSFNVNLGEGLNIMTGAVVTEGVTVGKGSLIHVQASLHHDSKIGEYCELLPGSHVLGNVTIGDFTSVGSGAIILPKLKIGNHVTIGAGAVVTKNIEDGLTIKGIPAK